MERAAAARLYGKLHEDRPYHDGTFTAWAEKPSRAFPYHYLDGVTVTVTQVDYTPDDDEFLTKEAAPWPSDSRK